MDFQYHYTEDQEQFRAEVRSWLEANIPEEMKVPVETDDFSEEMYHFWRQKHKEMGAKGWMYPTYPKEYGGGDLSVSHAIVIHEEFRRSGVKGPFSNGLLIPSLFVWATEEQKQRWLVPFLKGEQVFWQKFTEPKSGSDLASYQSKAVRDGDDWILNGSNAFVSAHNSPSPDWLWGPMQTDPDAPRHRNLGFFMIPGSAPGVEVVPQNLMHGREQHMIFLTDVRIPGDHLIGGDHDGWQVANTTLEQEHGGRGSAGYSDSVVDNLVDYMQSKMRNGSSPGGNPVVQQVAVQAYIEAHLDSLFGGRTYWMYTNRMEISWEGAAGSLYGREYTMRTMGKVRDVMGMDALIGSHDPLAPYGGMQEFEQRARFIRQHGAGSLNINKVVVARRIGISRTRERPAPTPATATSFAS